MDQQDRRIFHLGDVLSVTTSHLVSPRYMDGVYELVRYLTDLEPQVEGLVESMAPCRRYLIALFPQFDGLDMTDVEFENWRGWLESRQAEFGEWIEVRRPLAGEIA